MSKKYAVAVTMTEHKPNGVLNIITMLTIDTADGEDEARGRANRIASNTNPNHSIFTTIVVDVDDHGGWSSGQQKVE